MSGLQAHQGTVSHSRPLWIRASLVAQQKGLNTRFLSAPHSSQTLTGAMCSGVAWEANQSWFAGQPVDKQDTAFVMTKSVF